MATSWFDPGEAAEDGAGADPGVDEAPIVADLKALPDCIECSRGRNETVSPSFNF